MKFKFKLGDTVRYIGYRTEYNVVAIGDGKIGDGKNGNKAWAWIKLTKIDPRRTTSRSKIGEVFDVTLERLEVITRRAAHPLTTIFQDVKDETAKTQTSPIPPDLLEILNVKLQPFQKKMYDSLKTNNLGTL